MPWIDKGRAVLGSANAPAGSTSIACLRKADRTLGLSSTRISPILGRREAPRMVVPCIPEQRHAGPLSLASDGRSSRSADAAAAEARIRMRRSDRPARVPYCSRFDSRRKWTSGPRASSARTLTSIGACGEVRRSLKPPAEFSPRQRRRLMSTLHDNKSFACRACIRYRHVYGEP